MLRQVSAKKSGGLSARDVIAAVATSGIAFNVSGNGSETDTVKLTFSHCEPRIRRDDLMHLQLEMKIPHTQDVAELFEVVDRHIGGDWKTENPNGSFVEDDKAEPATFGRSQILDKFIPARYAYTYLNLIKDSLPQYESKLWRTQFPLRRRLADASTLSQFQHAVFTTNTMAENWVSCLRDAGLSEHQIGQWSTLLTETGKCYNPASRNACLRKSIQDAAKFLMSENGEQKSMEVWNAKQWDLSAVHGIEDHGSVDDARSVDALIKRLSFFEEAKIEEPPYKEGFLGVMKNELWRRVVPLALVTARLGSLYLQNSEDTPKHPKELWQLTVEELVNHPDIFCIPYHKDGVLRGSVCAPESHFKLVDGELVLPHHF